MTSFRFRFAALLQVRRHRRDLVREILARVLSDERRLRDERVRLEDSRIDQLAEMQRMTASGRVDLDKVAARRWHAGRLTVEIALAEQRREAAERQVEHVRRQLVQADQEVVLLEKLEDRHRAEHVAAAERAAQLEREDVWSAGRLREGAT
jgi:hypothetical protein